ncbi:MAG: hypothetical protein WBP33_15015 [Saprospiraceae bacterium]|nr:hypothetical protein [Candidatus Vicinibacter proximus]MCC6842232.1 hypothetical protein [Saprospiraceae bacterium]
MSRRLKFSTILMSVRLENFTCRMNEISYIKGTPTIWHEETPEIILSVTALT